MPSHGDFVARGLEVQEREGLDSWLSAEIADARSAFGGEFEERFDTAPPWRFAWEGERWTAGAMVNSVDSAGRRFPLLVALRAVVAADVGAATEACENAIYDAFEHRWSADELADALASADESGCEAGDCVEGWWTLGGERFPEASLPGRKPPGLVRTMLGGMERAAA
jgi:type VI secretion system protein ImpM